MRVTAIADSKLVELPDRRDAIPGEGIAYSSTAKNSASRVKNFGAKAVMEGSRTKVCLRAHNGYVSDLLQRLSGCCPNNIREYSEGKPLLIGCLKLLPAIQSIYLSFIFYLA